MSSCLYCSTQTFDSSPFCCKSCEVIYKLAQGFNIFEKRNTAEDDKFSFLDLASQRERFHLTADPLSYKFFVEGVDCVTCVHLLEEIPKYIPEVQTAKMNYGRSLLEIRIKENASLPDVCRQIEQLGYSLNILSPEEDSSSKIIEEEKRILKKLIVAGFFTGNIMLFAVPLYGGIAGDNAFYFRWITFFLFLPIVFYSASDFYVSSYRSLIQKKVNIDMMITLALWLGTILSFTGLVYNKDTVYFDSTASFIFSYFN